MKYLFSLVILFLSAAASPWAGAAPAGQLDPTFGDNGIRVAPFDRGGNQSDQSWATAAAPDGRIYMVGQVARSAQTVGIGLARLMPDTGALDGTLIDGSGQPGRVSYLPQGHSRAVPYAALVLENGQVLVAGTATPNGSTAGSLMVCMFNPDGTVVSGFGPAPEDGCAILDVGATGEAVATGITLDPQGNIVIAGYAQFNATERAVLARLYRSGELIPTFGSGGIRFPQFPPWATQTRFNAIAYSPDSRLVAVGRIKVENLDYDLLVAKFNWVTGGFDNTFHMNGFKQIDYADNLVNDDEATAVKVLEDSSIIVVGNAPWNSEGYLQPVAAKLSANGGFVAGFGGNNVGEPEYGGGCDFCTKRATSLTILNDGKIVIGGTMGIGGLPESSDLFAMLLDANGVRINAYGGNPFDQGTARIDITGNADAGFGLHAQGQRVLLGGYSLYPGLQNNNFVMIRLDHGLENQPGNIFTVTPNAGFNGTVSPIVPQQVVHSGYKAFTVTPNAGFSVKEILGTCPGSLIGNQYFVGPVTGNCQFTVNFAADVTLTYHAGENGSIEGPNPQTIPYNTNGEIVVAVPDAGYQFAAWSDGYPSSVRQDLGVTQNIEVTATFEVQTHIVTPIAGNNGALSPDLPQVVEHGEHVAFVIQPNPGFGVANYQGCNGTLIGNTYVTGPITSDCEVTVNFVPDNTQYALSYTAGSSCSLAGALEQTVVSGGDGTPVSVTPDPGFVFLQWSDGSTDAVRQDTHVFTNINVTAHCAPQGATIHTVTPVFGLGGALSPHVPMLVVEGDNVLFTVLPNPGFAIESVTGCNGSLVGNIYVTAPVFADCEVQATFVPSNEIFTLTYTAGANGLVNGQAQVQINVPAGGQGIKINAQPAPGFFFVQWSDGWQEQSRQDANVVGDISVTAQFAANGTPVHTVLPLSGLGGALSPPVPQQVADGNTVQFDVLPNEGFAIASVGGTCGGTLIGNQYTTHPIVGDCTVEASFIASDEIFTLTYLAGPNGQVNGQGMVVQNVVAGGTAEPVQAQALPGFFFVQWSDGWIESLRQDSNVVGDIEVTAQFAANGTPVFTVTPIAGPNGAFFPASPQQIAQGNTAEFIVAASNGYVIESLGGTCGGNLVGDVYTTDPVVANCTIEATFADDISDRIFYNGFGFGEEQE